MQRPQGEITLNDILITEELSRRSPRPPNWQAQAQAMQPLARQMAQGSQSLLQTLADIALELCQADTAGVSLLETTPDGEEIFRARVLAGTLAHHVGGSTKRKESPCGVCLEYGTPVLFSHPERYFTYFQEANTPIVEGLVLPLIADNHALGTIWIMSHDSRRHFDAEDVRVMTSLADFTAAALLLDRRQTQELLAKNAQLEAEVGDRLLAEIALRESEERTRALIENLPGGAAFVVDRNLRYLLAQGEALSAVGFKSEDFVGKTIFEVLPPQLTANYEQWYRQGLAGEPFEYEHNAHDRTYISRGTPLRSADGEVYAVLAVSYDITDRKRREAHQNLLVEIGDDLSRLVMPDKIMQAVGARLGEYLNLGVCVFVDVDEERGEVTVYHGWNKEGVPSLKQTFRMVEYLSDEFTRASRAGEIFVVRDTATDARVDADAYARLNIGAWLGVPFHREGRWTAFLSVTDIAPRDWRDDEIELVRNIADRVFPRIERARAEESLVESEQKYRSLFNSIDDGFCIIERVAGEPIDFRYIEANPAFAAQTGITDIVGKTIREVVFGVPEAVYEMYESVLNTGESIRFEIDVPSIGRILEVYALRIEGEPRLTVIFKDISDRKRAEERQVFLLKLSDALRPLADPIVVQETACRVLGEHLGANRVLYAETSESPGSPALIRVSDYTAGVPSRVGWHRLDDYGKFVTETWRAGRNLLWSSLDDLPNLQADERAAYEAVEIEAIIGVPLVKEGRFEAFLAVHQATLRKWTADEIALAEETAERTWAAVERARAEAGLRVSEEKYRLLFNSIDEGYALCEMLYDDNETPIDWKILEVNPAFESLTGLVDAAGKSARELNQPLNANWLHTFSTVAQTGESTRFEHYIDSVDYWLEILVSRIDEDKHHIVVVFNNITDRKQAEAERIRLIEEQAAREEERQRAETLAELDRTKTLFFSNISHEFRTPLTLLLAPLQDALSDAEGGMLFDHATQTRSDHRVNPLSSSQRERLELAHRNATRLLKLVNTLLDFSRIEAGRMEAVYESTDLAAYTTQLASVFRSAIERAGLRLRVDCPPLPQPVYVDREMWEKIVLNLLSNAFKFTLEGEIAVRLYSAQGECVMLQIQDTGTGISPEDLPHLFERFYQVRGAKARTHEGSGIGLALVQELIRMHGGTIDVSSVVGQRTCFTVTIPSGTAHLPSDRLRRVVGDRNTTRTLVSTALGAAPYVEEAERWLPFFRAEGAEGAEGAEEATTNSQFTVHNSQLTYHDAALMRRTPPHPPASPLTTHHSPRILLVDDNTDMRDYLTRILNDRFQVEAVADGAAAIAAARAQVPDLVLSDVMMPGIDGFGLLQALRADPQTREIPIILLSARAGEESVVSGLEAGADDYLIKPFSAAELVSRVNAHLQMAQLRSQTLRQERTINRRKDELLSTVSHELNTPLVAILGWTRLLRSAPPSQSMLMKSLETIERNATLQAKLIQDLLDISRIEAGKLRLSLEPVELKSVIEMAIAAVKTAAIAKDIHLEWKRSSVQETAEITILGDRERLQQIICNILTNAIKFTPQGGTVEISLTRVESRGKRAEGAEGAEGEITTPDSRRATPNSYAQIQIKDTGIGISPDFLPHVFDRFRQAEGENSAKGLGLGLAIVRHLVELHNGTIHAESLGVGQGATFTVGLPIFQ